LTEVLTTAPVLHSCIALLRRAVAISSDARVGVYDCLYVALAEQLRCELVTSDYKLINNLQPSFPFIISLAALP
jgi:predicted nucleic acid-binding protein